VPRRPSGTMVSSIFSRCCPVSDDPISSLNPGVAVEPGLTALTRMRRALRSVAQVRAKERTAAFVAA
jgi:hypothetical protein